VSADAPRFRVLLGHLEDGLTAEGVVRTLDLPSRARPDRPYLVINMVATLDGRASIRGRAGPIGNDADRELFHHLRTQGDAVMAGGETVRIERYGRLTRDARLRALREEAGTRAEPLAVVASRGLGLPTDLPLLAEPGRDVAIVTDAQHDLPPVPARVHYLRAALPDALRRLRRDYGVRSIVCEGGPDLNASLLPTGLADELWVCIAPLLAGGIEPLTIYSGPVLDPPLALEPVWLLESGRYLFGRYCVSSRAISSNTAT
jgi:riboflavin biosynthesis pyrimidine reductase